jgi:hypothetical protein
MEVYVGREEDGGEVNGEGKMVCKGGRDER